MTTLLICLAILAAAVWIVTKAAPYLKENSANLTAAIARVRDAITLTNKALDTVRPFLPAPGAGAFDKIVSAAKIGVEHAEQLHRIGSLPADSRKYAARDYVFRALKLAGVEITSDVEKLIDGAIEAEVFEIGFPLVQLRAIGNIETGAAANDLDGGADDTVSPE